MQVRLPIQFIDLLVVVGGDDTHTTTTTTTCVCVSQDPEARQGSQLDQKIAHEEKKHNTSVKGGKKHFDTDRTRTCAANAN